MLKNTLWESIIYAIQDQEEGSCTLDPLNLCLSSVIDLHDKSNESLMLRLKSSLPYQENSVNHVHREQCIAITWPAACVAVAPWARLTTPARSASPQWTAVAVLWEPTWTKRGSVWTGKAVPAIIRTTLFHLERLSTKTKAHGKYRGQWWQELGIKG